MRPFRGRSISALPTLLSSLAPMLQAIQSSCPRIDPRRNSGVGNKQQLVVLRALIPKRQSCSVGVAIFGKVRPVSPQDIRSLAVPIGEQATARHAESAKDELKFSSMTCGNARSLLFGKIGEAVPVSRRSVRSMGAREPSSRFGEYSICMQLPGDFIWITGRFRIEILQGLDGIARKLQFLLELRFEGIGIVAVGADDERNAVFPTGSETVRDGLPYQSSVDNGIKDIADRSSRLFSADNSFSGPVARRSDKTPVAPTSRENSLPAISACGRQR